MLGSAGRQGKVRIFALLISLEFLLLSLMYDMSCLCTSVHSILSHLSTPFYAALLAGYAQALSLQLRAPHLCQDAPSNRGVRASCTVQHVNKHGVSSRCRGTRGLSCGEGLAPPKSQDGVLLVALPDFKNSTQSPGLVMVSGFSTLCVVGAGCHNMPSYCRSVTAGAHTFRGNDLALAAIDCNLAAEGLWARLPSPRGGKDPPSQSQADIGDGHR